MPNPPPDQSMQKTCARCSAGFSIPPQERERLTRKFGTYREPKVCARCRKERRKFSGLADNIVTLHAFAFGECATDEQIELLRWLAQQTVLTASEAGILDGWKLFQPLGKTGSDAQRTAEAARSRIGSMREKRHQALLKKHGTTELLDIETELRTHIDAIEGIVKEYFG